jgi:hypothetical protein
MAERISFVIGDRVQKTRGYGWPGVVVAVFATLGGDCRVVVECDVPQVRGALHIYAPEQLCKTEVEVR